MSSSTDMAPDQDLESWLRLSLIPGLGEGVFRRLLVAFGSPQQILSAPPAELSRFVTPELAAIIRHGGAEESQVDVVAGWLQDEANHVITLADATYPKCWLQISDPPPLVYVKGSPALLNHDALAVVGSRNATPQGIANAEMFARALSDAGLTIVSGLALGIDAAAHRGGLAGSASSVAVVGTGLDIVYPARNRGIARELAARGALVSEFHLTTRPHSANFPRRNRLISGLARGCLVVEAAHQSGSLITARFANEQGKDVFAVPGSIHSPFSKGCHQLIKQGAKLVETAQDILEELHLHSPGLSSGPALQPVEPNEQLLLDHLGFDPCDIDSLSSRCGLQQDVVAALLTQLEIDGRVVALPGGRFQRVT